MTRAKERLILSGAARLDAWPEAGSPIAWIGPAVVPDIAERVDDGSGISEAGVRFTFVGAQAEGELPDRVARIGFATTTESAPPPPKPASPCPTVTTLSYSSLEEYHRCGYRFYAERVLGLPGRRPQVGAGPSGIERGVLVHELLERLDFRRPTVPELPADPEVQALIERFAASELCRRLGRATSVRREQRFRFLLDHHTLVHGAIDVLAREPGQMLVVDYKTGTQTRSYALQQLIYALAVLRSGAEQVEVIHVFLERMDQTTSAVFSRAQINDLEARLAARMPRKGDYTVTDTPHRAICDGCPAEGGLCSWPLAMTRRAAPDQLF
jgi:ATP-dependent exoDNAse (exonuclease V) beta subunit